MSDNDRPANLRIRLEALAAFLPLFESPDFSYGTWDTSEGHLPYFFQSEDAGRFVQTAYEHGWCSSNINWVEWIGTADAERFKDGPEPIAEATVSDLEHLLTTFIRQDRFVEGNLDALYQSGHLTAITRRAATLLQELDD